MLDQLLGRAELKDEIDELQTETERLRNQLEAEKERRADAVRERQEAEETINRLEDRIAELKDKAERSSTEREIRSRGEETLRGSRLRDICARLRSYQAPEEGALTAYIADDIPPEVTDLLGDRTAIIRRTKPCLTCIDDAGIVSCALSLPNPPSPFVTWEEEFRIHREWIEPTGKFALALVRSDLFALGEYQGTERMSIQGFTTEVKEKHSKGGYSQSRFERLREGQIDDHLDRVRSTLAERDVDRLFLVGEQTIIDRVDSDADATAAVDATGDPEDALADAFHEFFSVRLRLV
ncbi:MAG: Vms1/Ankzf1 family peptidyl-tRNA hydrolase [Halobacteriaceae archaeon]